MENIVATVSEVVSVKKAYDIAFPHLGIFIEKLKNSLTIGNFTIAYYGIIIAVAMLIGFTVVLNLAKKKGIKEEYIYDSFILIIILGIIGARIYYVIFNWDYYSRRLPEILNIRGGGLAIFGGIILSLIGLFVYCKIKKCNFLELMDVTIIGVAIGQAIGRYGNFFNMEAYGDYTNNIFAMRMNTIYLDADNISMLQLINATTENGAKYIQAHPTFFYESTLNIFLFIILLVLINKFYKFKGQIFATYLIGYGIIRCFVESLRMDSLMLYSFRVSQIVAIIAVVIGIVIMVLGINGNKKKINKNNKKVRRKVTNETRNSRTSKRR